MSLSLSDMHQTRTATRIEAMAQHSCAQGHTEVSLNDAPSFNPETLAKSLFNPRPSETLAKSLFTETLAKSFFNPRPSTLRPAP